MSALVSGTWTVGQKKPQKTTQENIPYKITKHEVVHVLPTGKVKINKPGHGSYNDAYC